MRSACALCMVLTASCASESDFDASPEVEVAVAVEALTYAESNGRVSMEAEQWTSRASGTGVAARSSWNWTTAIGGYSGGGAVVATPNTGVNTGDTTAGPRLDYVANFARTGTWYLWVRMRGRSGTDDSVHVGFDGVPLSYGAMGVADTSGAWAWKRYAGSRRLAFNVRTVGTHTVNLWMREDGTAVDKLYMTQDPNAVPSGWGPAPTPAPSTGTGGSGGSTGGSGGSTGGSGGSTGGSGGSGGSTGGTSGASGSGGTGGTDGGSCLAARRLWFEDFETGNYARWSGNRYTSTLNTGGCPQSGFSTQRSVAGTQSHRTSVSCTAGSNHRVYGGVQFSGDTPLRSYTNSGTGIDAPNGIVITFWAWLDAAGFGDRRWHSVFTANNTCDYRDQVVTLGLEDASNYLIPAHIVSTGGSVLFDSVRSPMPFRSWARITIYLNYYTGAMHVWQDGRHQIRAQFSRATRDICQFHWGLYASGNNSSIVLFEDEMSLWKLDAPLTDFTSEPWLGQTTPVCN